MICPAAICGLGLPVKAAIRTDLATDRQADVGCRFSRSELAFRALVSLLSGRIESMQIPMPRHDAAADLAPLVGQESGRPTAFVDRRQSGPASPGSERRQFASSHAGLSPQARELALAIDGYKVRHRRRYITFEEMLAVIADLGYHRSEP